LIFNRILSQRLAISLMEFSIVLYRVKFNISTALNHGK
jgi:hypothetical protein